MTESESLACDALMRSVEAVAAVAWIAMSVWPFFHGFL